MHAAEVAGGVVPLIGDGVQPHDATQPVEVEGRGGDLVAARARAVPGHVTWTVPGHLA